MKNLDMNKLDLDKLEQQLNYRYYKKWGNTLIKTSRLGYDIPAIPIGAKVPFLNTIIGKYRLFFNQCPKCNSSAPKLDNCSVCEGDRTRLYSKSKEDVLEEKQLLWNRYVYEIITKEDKTTTPCKK